MPLRKLPLTETERSPEILQKTKVDNQHTQQKEEPTSSVGNLRNMESKAILHMFVDLRKPSTFAKDQELTDHSIKTLRLWNWFWWWCYNITREISNTLRSEHRPYFRDTLWSFPGLSIPLFSGDHQDPNTLVHYGNLSCNAWHGKTWRCLWVWRE